MNQYQEIPKNISKKTHLNKCIDVPAPIIEQQIQKLYLPNTDEHAWNSKIEVTIRIFSKVANQKLKPIDCLLNTKKNC